MLGVKEERPLNIRFKNIQGCVLTKSIAGFRRKASCGPRNGVSFISLPPAFGELLLLAYAHYEHFTWRWWYECTTICMEMLA